MADAGPEIQLDLGLPADVQNGAGSPTLLVQGSTGIAPDPNVVRFRKTDVSAIAGLYLEEDTFFYSAIETSLDTITVTFVCRMLRPGRGIEEIIFERNARSDADINESVELLGEGWLQGVQASHEEAGGRIGTIFVKAGLRRGGVTSRLLSEILFSDYLQQFGHLSWPGSPIRSTLEGVGFNRVVTGTDPAAGVNFSETVPTNRRWVIHGLSYRLVTEATVGERQAQIRFTRNGVRFILIQSVTTQPASSTKSYYYFNSIEAAIPSTFHQYHPLPPDVILLTGDILSGVIGTIRPLDVVSNIFIYLTEYIERE